MGEGRGEGERLVFTPHPVPLPQGAREPAASLNPMLYAIPAEMSQEPELIGAHYRDFGPTLATEKLVERHGQRLSVEGTRQLLIAAGYRQPGKGSKAKIDALPFNWITLWEKDHE